MLARKGLHNCCVAGAICITRGLYLSSKFNAVLTSISLFDVHCHRRRLQTDIDLRHLQLYQLPHLRRMSYIIQNYLLLLGVMSHTFE